MIDMLWWGFLTLLLGYIIFYIWALIFRIIPWLNIAVIEVCSLTLLQIVATILFFSIGLCLFVFCLIFLAGFLLSR